MAQKTQITYMRTVLALVATLIVSVALAPGANGGTPSIMPVSDVREGMTGYGLTVFNGTQIDTFDVEVLAVLKGFGVQRDAIVARFSGGPLAHTGVAQGMSGSPVFIDGKIIGAVAWTSTFTKEPLGGITPFEYMDDIRNRPMTPPDERSYTSAPLDPADLFNPPDRPERPAWARDIRAEAEPELRAREIPESWSDSPDLAKYSGARLVPIQTPVSVSGIDPAAFADLQSLLDPYNMRVVQGGTMSSDSTADAELVPGAALGVALATGDISMVGVGTVTWRDGETVLGFGHPMFFKGQVDFPMSLAHVHFMWPSQVISFKLASGGPIVGSLRQDRRFGVAGVIGELPDMLPVEINIRGGKEPHSVRFEVVRDRDLTPNIIGVGLMGSLYDLEKLGGPASVELTSRIEVDGFEPIVRRNFYTDGSGLALAARAAIRPLSFLSRNPFEPVHVRRVSFDVEFTEHIEAAFLTGLEIPRRVVRPGENLTVRALLQTYLGKDREVSADLFIPEETPDGVYTLRVGGGAEAEQWQVNRMPGRFIPDGLPHLVELLRYEERNDVLHCQIVNERLGMTVEDRILPDLPPTVFETLRHAVPSGRVGPVYGEPVVDNKTPVDTYIIGEREITIAVYRHARPR